MPSVFLVSDTHFGHMGVCKFTRNDGVTKLRPYSTPEEMDEDMIAKWNAKVKPTDKVYHLGDVVINRKALPTLHRLNGDKVLIRGNHDIFRDDENDLRYHCVCVEQTDFAPILFEDVIARIEAEGGSVGFKNGNGPTM